MEIRRGFVELRLYKNLSFASGIGAVLFSGERNELDIPRRSLGNAIICNPFKLVKTWDENRLELFDLSKDIGEENDLSEKMPAKTRDLHGQMTTFLSRVNAETARTRR